MQAMKTKEDVLIEQVRKGKRSFFHPNAVAAVTALPACATSVWGGQGIPWQAASGLVSPQEEYWSRAKPPGLPPALPVEEPTLHLLFTGGKSGNRWGVGFQLQSCTPSNQQEVQEVTRTSSNCQLASQSTGKREVTEARRREERRGEEKSARRGERWQEVRCELPRETFVQQPYSMKQLYWVGCSYSYQCSLHLSTKIQEFSKDLQVKHLKLHLQKMLKVPVVIIPA